MLNEQRPRTGVSRGGLTRLWPRKERVKLRAFGRAIYGCSRGGQDVGPREKKGSLLPQQSDTLQGKVWAHYLQKGLPTSGGSTVAWEAVGDSVLGTGFPANWV